jgi:protein transport protein SEC61 subunit gamma-like protein
VKILAENVFKTNNVTSKNVGQTLKSYLRVLKLTKKPSGEEFQMISKVAGIGILLAGFVGFIIYIMLTEIPKMV